MAGGTSFKQIGYHRIPDLTFYGQVPMGNSIMILEARDSIPECY